MLSLTFDELLFVTSVADPAKPLSFPFPAGINWPQWDPLNTRQIPGMIRPARHRVPQSDQASDNERQIEQPGVAVGAKPRTRKPGTRRRTPARRESGGSNRGGRESSPLSWGKKVVATEAPVDVGVQETAGGIFARQ